MVVLTPNDQLENTSYRVKEHNLLIIIQELSRGQKLLKQLKPRSKILFKPQVAKSPEVDDLGATLDKIAREAVEESKIQEPVEESKELASTVITTVIEEGKLESDA